MDVEFGFVVFSIHRHINYEMGIVLQLQKEAVSTYAMTVQLATSRRLANTHFVGFQATVTSGKFERLLLDQQERCMIDK